MLTGIIIFILIYLIYFLPALIARIRCHPNDIAIFILNLFLGWTFLGWVIALIWSTTFINKSNYHD